MDFIFRRVAALTEFRKLYDGAKHNRFPSVSQGLNSVHKNVLAATLMKKTGKKGFIILPDEGAVTVCAEDLNALGFKTLTLSDREYNFRQDLSHSREAEQIRTGTLSNILERAFDVVLMSAAAASSRVIPRKMLEERTVVLKTGNEYNTDDLMKLLVSCGYVRTDMVEGAGQFALRGGIMDIFLPNMDKAVRIDFFGDEIDVMGAFDTDSQRREENIEEIKIIPAAENCPTSPEALAEMLEKKAKGNYNSEFKGRLIADASRLREGLPVANDCYLDEIYGTDFSSVFDYIEADDLLFVFETGEAAKRIKAHYEVVAEEMAGYVEQNALPKKFSVPYLDYARFIACSGQKSVCFFEDIPKTSYEIPLKELYSFSLSSAPDFVGRTDILVEDIEELNGLIVIAAGARRAAQNLAEELERRGVNAAFRENDVGESGVFVVEGGLSSGFSIHSEHFTFITCHRGNFKAIKARRRKNSIGSLEELREGDYVVHEAHGIGVFEGVHQISAHGITKDYIKIHYKGADVLYVPVQNLDMVSKYIGAKDESGRVKVNKMGGTEWKKTKAKVRAGARDMAKQLTVLYKNRLMAKGYAFPTDSELQMDFEARFEFDETDDQLRSAAEIKKDMERSTPMDRLLCGDVGVGKTEVALRAAFKCVADGRQVALLVPTTILAWQHYRVATERFGMLPVNVDMLSRFRTAKQQTEIKKNLKSGKIDMIIGTHSLIAKDVDFSDLGLLIIDEEQRFGVEQKEKLKEKYPSVDILTLSATPIPRTLNMALSGLRDMSSIEEPPHDRRPVQTYLIEKDKVVVAEAIERELRRGGQVYFLHNRTDNIDHVAAEIHSLVPEARIETAHGKMDEATLSKIWQRMLNRETDVLVCTTIIETGVDVPNANTIIIENADRFGLSQLHQLRGRVGRSTRRAFAYLMVDENREISEISRRRLEAIRDYTEFGAGFKIAMRDLEIRGAGSILGGDQSGHLESVGYEMYIKILQDAIAEEKGEKRAEEKECTLEFRMAAHIPENYISSLPQRLGIYRRIAKIRNQADADDVMDELIDRFSEPPKAVTELISVALLRAKCARVGISEAKDLGGSLYIRFSEWNNDYLKVFNQFFGSRFKIAPGEVPTVYIKTKKDVTPLDDLKLFVKKTDI